MAMNTVQALNQLKPLFPRDVELYVRPEGRRWEFGYLKKLPGEVWHWTLAYEGTIEALVALVKERIGEKLARLEAEYQLSRRHMEAE